MPEAARERLVLRRAEELARLGYFVFDTQRNETTYLSPGLIKIASALGDTKDSASYFNLLGRVHKDDRQRVDVATRCSFEEGYPLDVEFRTLTTTGDIQHLWMTDDRILDPETGEPIRIGIVQDITERRNGEERHRKQAALRKAMTRNAVDCIVTFDSGGQILEFNPAAERVFGLAAHRAIGKPIIRTLFHPRDWENLQSKLKLLFDGGPELDENPRIEVLGLCDDGRQVPLEATVTTVAVNGRRYYSAQMRDLTLRREQESELRVAKEEAEEASKAKSVFLAGMSHEIRTPLNGTLGALGALEDTDLNPEQRNLVNLAINSGESLLVLINDVLDLSRIEARQVDLVMAIFDLEELLQSTISVFHEQALKKRVSLTCSIDDDVPAMCLSDAARIGQILRNMTSNAINHTVNGSVKIQIGRAPEQDDCDPGLKFTITDTGSGIPEAVQGSLFNEFVTTASGSTKLSSGTGLGLSICKTLVEAFGGKIGFSSKENEGSTFWFSIPAGLALDVPSSAPAGQDRARQDAKPHTLSGHILLAEDSNTNAFVVQNILGRRGLTIDHVTNGRDVISALEHTHYDLILMDISMPVMDGLSAISLIRAMPSDHCEIPIIALTAHAINGDRTECLKTGASEYLTKPFRKDVLIDLVARFLPDAPPEHDDEILFCSQSFDKIWEGVEAAQIKPVVQSYCEETRTRRAKIFQFMKDENWDGVEIEAHALKSSSLNMGLLNLGDRAGGLELSAASDAPANCLEATDWLASLVDSSLDALESHVTNWLNPSIRRTL